MALGSLPATQQNLPQLNQGISHPIDQEISQANDQTISHLS